MIWFVRYCVDAGGLEGILEWGRAYCVREMPCGTVQLRNGLVFSAHRFSGYQ